MINKVEAIKAVRRACAVIPMMPQDEVFVAELTEELQLLANNEQELTWLVNTARRVMTKWQSIAEFRGLFCTRFTPADGFANTCTMPGFTTEDLENAFRAREAAENDRRLLSYTAEVRGLVNGEALPFELPALSRMPGGQRIGRTETIRANLPVLEAELASAPCRPRRSEEETQRLVAELRSHLRDCAEEPTGAHGKD
jgi:hypothetical protein